MPSSERCAIIALQNRTRDFTGFTVREIERNTKFTAELSKELKHFWQAYGGIFDTDLSSDCAFLDNELAGLQTLLTSTIPSALHNILVSIETTDQSFAVSTQNATTEISNLTIIADELVGSISQPSFTSTFSAGTLLNKLAPKLKQGTASQNQVAFIQSVAEAFGISERKAMELFKYIVFECGLSWKDLPTTISQEQVDAYRELYDSIPFYRIDWRMNALGAYLVVLTCDNKLNEISSATGMPVSWMQSILFREQFCVDFTDDIMDSLVQQGLRKDSSTGIGQIFSKTAIKVINHHREAGHPWYQQDALGIVNREYDFNSDVDRLTIWSKLKYDPYFNLELMALTLQYEIDMQTAVKADPSTFVRDDYSTYTQEDITRTFAYYNGEWSYGEAVYEYYEIFETLST